MVWKKKLFNTNSFALQPNATLKKKEEGGGRGVNNENLFLSKIGVKALSSPKSLEHFILFQKRKTRPTFVERQNNGRRPGKVWNGSKDVGQILQSPARIGAFQ